MKRLIANYVPFVLGIYALFASSALTGEVQKDRLSVFVSIPPQAYFVERVGGSTIEVEVLVRPGQTPETFEPTPQQMTCLSQADLYFRIGLPFEDRLLEKIQTTIEKLCVVDTRQGIKLRSMAGPYEGGKQDPHIWLDPKLIEIQATTICMALSRLDSANADTYESNMQTFKADLKEVNAKITQQLAPFKGRKFYVFHPSYGYFGDAYGLIQVAVEIEGKEPSARQLANLIENAKREGVKAIFVQPQFSAKSAEVVARAIGAEVVSLDPLSRDYLNNLKDMAGKVAKALRDNRD